ncbi:GntR family transcriptional regulator [Rivibacter subsaxonicus]|uniref:DNA-binding GntR family transcriptional regulator n=1 Tax=Rivibacter subsaxonicus TaxID=457575 RepID=A0A4Q7VH10_9BURK|nr:GntR family transcriptional regulator [Rivibacter subsaxonicus]RZT95317.1 DNA-binding GntR family transcriptional regulator [Rivibacter subsaxonicus]
MSDLSDLGPLVRPASLHESVAARLRALIFDRGLAPGTLIDELALAHEWGISRTPLREALKVLASEGLVQPQPRRGCVVAEISEDDARQLFPVMALLEGRCAFEAARNASDAELVELEGLHAQLEHHAAIGDTDGYYRANHLFHTRVQALAHNPWLSRATDQLRVFMRLLRGRQLNLPGRMDVSIGEHRALIAALLARDAKAAQREMHDHLMAQLEALEALRATEAMGHAPKVVRKAVKPRSRR